METSISEVMAWQWVVISLVVPLAVALLVAWPFWRRPTRDPVGSMLGAGVALAFALAFIGREYTSVHAVWSKCMEAGAVCSFTPEPYVRYFLYIVIGMLQTFALFAIGGRIEHRRRESRIAPEWRR